MFLGTVEGVVMVYKVVLGAEDEATIARMERRVALRRGKRPIEQIAVLPHFHHVLVLQGQRPTLGFASL